LIQVLCRATIGTGTIEFLVFSAQNDAITDVSMSYTE